MTMTKDQAIEQVVGQLDGPITLDEFCERVLALWPSRAKKPAAAIRQTLRYAHAGKSVILLDARTIVPLRVALRGVRFRIPLSRQEVKQGLLFLSPNFTYFVPYDVPAEDVQLLDAGGRALSTRLLSLKETRQTVFGPQAIEMRAFDLRGWYEKNKVKRDDSLLVTVADWEARQFQLAHEAARQRRRRRAEIEERNQELAALLFDMLEAARDEQVWGFEAVLTAHARLSEPTGYPGDHWVQVIEQDRRMRWDGATLRYADSFSPLEHLVMEARGEQQVQQAPVSPEKARQVYRFKAALKHRKGLWRRIELQGQHTLADFDAELREAFEHDRWDHLSGFWKLVRRGQSRRFRQVDLGSINPFGEGEAAGRSIAGLGLEPGEQLKYVYDFGDWIEHRVTLEAIEKAQEGVDYPRLVDQNRPRYRYCRHCKEQKRKTVATWICIECSNQEQAEVLVCEDCLDAHHPDHYADEVLY
jgi:hypothetical protein